VVALAVAVVLVPLEATAKFHLLDTAALILDLI
jgi:hypothetical protein